MAAALGQAEGTLSFADFACLVQRLHLANAQLIAVPLPTPPLHQVG